jgi:hypothetical protein
MHYQNKYDPFLESLDNNGNSINAWKSPVALQQCPLYMLALTFEEKTIEVTLGLN